MQRFRHAGRGPKSTLVLSLLLALTSLALFQVAYAAEPPYPGPPGLPGIPPGPSLGCNPAGTTNATWICGFDPLSTVTFKVNGHYAGTAQADSNGCVLVVVTFLHGQVSVSGNAPVATRHGKNYLIVVGTRTHNGVKQEVGRRLAFSTPAAGTNSCRSHTSPPPVPPPTSFPIGGGTTIPPRPTTTLFPVVTTAHGYTPTTLAWVIKTPLSDSPNRVILESSLIAAVLAAALAAGALGAIWSGGDRAGEAAAGAAGGEAAGADAGAGNDAAGEVGEAGDAPSGPAAAGAATSTASGASAFQRSYPDASPGGGAT
jgi:hypothetical protein